MKTYFIKRFFLLFPTLFGITLIVFLISHLAPGGPLEREIAKLKGYSNLQGANTAQITEEEIKLLKKKLHLDKPVVISYFFWLKELLNFDLGESRIYSQDVFELIIEKIPVSLFFGLSGFFLSYLICIPLGIFKAISHGSKFDLITSTMILMNYSIPIFALSMLLIYIFASGEIEFLSFFPLGYEVSDNYESLNTTGKILDRLHHMFLPVLCYVSGSFAVLTLLMKNSLLEQISKEYVILAISKGLSFKKAIFKHALQNSLIPIATGFGSNLNLIFAGSLIIELVFSIDGMGLLGFQAITDRDTNLMMGLLLVQSFLSLFGNIISDLCYIVIDPRIHFN